MSTRRHVVILVSLLAAHELASRALDAADVSARLLSPSSTTGLAAALATASFLAVRLALVFGLPAYTAFIATRLVSSIVQRGRPRIPETPIVS